MGVWSVGGIPLVTVIKNTVMFSMVEIPNVIFSPDSAGMQKTNLWNVIRSRNSFRTYRARMLIRTAG